MRHTFLCHTTQDSQVLRRVTLCYMGRSRKTAKNAGTAFERSVADYLAEKIDDRIDRAPKTGAKDKGDIAGVRYKGHKVTIECKDYGGRLNPPQWVAEAHTENINNNGLVGVVVAKRRGTTKPEDQWVIMTLSELTTLLKAGQ